jgi:O-antigen/teichoic acid export membrane protein
MRMLAVPSVLLGQSVAIVLFPKIARMTREGIETASSIKTVATVLSLVAIPVFSVPLLLGPEIFSLMFGSEWRDAGVAASALSPWLAASLIASPLSSVLTVHQRLERLLFLGVIEASLRIGAFSVGSWANNWRLGLGLYSAAGLVIAFFGLSWVLGLSGTNIRNWLLTWTIQQGLMLGVIAALACSRFVGFANHQLPYLAVSSTILMIVFVTAVWNLRSVLRSVQGAKD